MPHLTHWPCTIQSLPAAGCGIFLGCAGAAFRTKRGGAHMASVQARLPLKHTGFVHDVAYDFFGERLATAGADHVVNVYAVNEEGQWVLQSSISAHTAPIMRLDWAHPEFGTLIASASLDHKVAIWEEQEMVDEATGTVQLQFRCAGRLEDSRLGVNDVQFAPRHAGLQVATGSADGNVRVYKVTDSTDTQHWQLQATFQADEHDVRGVAWCTSRNDASMLVVGGAMPVVSVWMQCTDPKEWRCCAELCGHSGAVHGVAWAPECGRGFHCLASASADGTLRVWKLEAAEGTSSAPRAEAGAAPATDSALAPVQAAQAGLRVSSEGVFDDHRSPVWRVQFDVTGTHITSCGDDGVLRVWKRDFSGKWVAASQVAVTAPRDLSEAEASALTGHYTPSEDTGLSQGEGVGAPGGSAAPAEGHQALPESGGGDDRQEGDDAPS